MKQAALRRKILKERGIVLEKHTRKPLPPPTPDEIPRDFKKTPLMRLLELKHSDSIENLILIGSIYTIAKRLQTDPTTISKWRKRILQAKEKKFWGQFKTESKEEKC